MILWSPSKCLQCGWICVCQKSYNLHQTTWRMSWLRRKHACIGKSRSVFLVCPLLEALQQGPTGKRGEKTSMGNNLIKELPSKKLLPSSQIQGTRKEGTPCTLYLLYPLRGIKQLPCPLQTQEQSWALTVAAANRILGPVSWPSPAERRPSTCFANAQAAGLRRALGSFKI